MQQRPRELGYAGTEHPDAHRFSEDHPRRARAIHGRRHRSRYHRKTSHRKILRAYKEHYVRPVLQEYDKRAFNAAIDSLCGWPYDEWQTSYAALPMALVEIDGDLYIWDAYRTWAVVRATGRWPLAMLDSSLESTTHMTCPLCQEPLAPVMHVLSQCVATAAIYRDMLWGRVDQFDEQRPPSDTMRHHLFGKRLDLVTEAQESAIARYRYVHQCCTVAVRALRSCE